jgi:hypothetical protein
MLRDNHILFNLRANLRCMKHFTSIPLLPTLCIEDSFEPYTSVWSTVTHILLKPKLKIDAWSISHLSLCNICRIYWSAPLLFQNSSNPSCLVRFKYLISLTFKPINRLFNSIFGAMESSMQIEFIWNYLQKGL